MAEAEKPLVYIVLGVAGSGRREVLAYLLEGGLAESDRAVVFLSERETADPADARLGEIQRWSWTDGAVTGAVPMSSRVPKVTARPATKSR